MRLVLLVMVLIGSEWQVSAQTTANNCNALVAESSTKLVFEVTKKTPLKRTPVSQSQGEFQAAAKIDFAALPGRIPAGSSGLLVGSEKLDKLKERADQVPVIAPGRTLISKSMRMTDKMLIVELEDVSFQTLFFPKMLRDWTWAQLSHALTPCSKSRTSNCSNLKLVEPAIQCPVPSSAQEEVEVRRPQRPRGANNAQSM